MTEHITPMTNASIALLLARDYAERSMYIFLPDDEQKRAIGLCEKQLRKAAEHLGFELVRSESIDMGR